MKSLLLAVALFVSPATNARDLPRSPEDQTQLVLLMIGQAPFQGSIFGDLKLSNTGDTDITRIHWDLKGYNFSATDNCPEVLAPGRSCRIRISYYNSAPGYASASLLVWTSEKTYDVRVSASGAEDPSRHKPRPLP